MLKLRRPAISGAAFARVHSIGTAALRAARRNHPDTEPDRSTATDAGCGTCHGDHIPDQRVPDPAQFVPDPQRAGNTPVAEITTVTAPMLWCADCRSWFHAVGCYSIHRADGPHPHTR